MTILSEIAFGKQFEHIVAEVYARQRWPDAILVENPTFADIDFQVVIPKSDRPPELVAWLEVKARRIPSTKYTDTIVASRKYLAALAGQKFFKVPTVCLVIFTDTVAAFNLHEPPDGGRNVTRFDRPDQTIPHVLYNHSRFTWHPDQFYSIKTTLKEEKE